jgi:hypothetical protein
MNDIKTNRGVKGMPDYKKMYFELAARVADAVALLIEAERNGEEAFIEGQDSPVVQILPGAEGGEEAGD